MHHFDPITPVEETLGTLGDLVTQGKIRFIGTSNYTGDELRRSSPTSATDTPPRISSVQNMYHLLKRGIEDDLVPACQETGTSVIVYGVLARGVLARNYRSSAQPPKGSRAESSANVQADLDPDVLSVAQRLQEFARKYGKSGSQLAVAWALRIQEVSTVLIGIRNKQHLKEIVPGTDWILSDEELNEINRIVGDINRFQHLALGAKFHPK